MLTITHTSYPNTYYLLRWRTNNDDGNDNTTDDDDDNGDNDNEKPLHRLCSLFHVCDGGGGGACISTHMKFIVYLQLPCLPHIIRPFPVCCSLNFQLFHTSNESACNMQRFLVFFRVSLSRGCALFSHIRENCFYIELPSTFNSLCIKCRRCREEHTIDLFKHDTNKLNKRYIYGTGTNILKLHILNYLWWARAHNIMCFIYFGRSAVIVVSKQTH